MNGVIDSGEECDDGNNMDRDGCSSSCKRENSLCWDGRLDGAEIARSEHLEEGSLPLQTLRADIDFARATAITTYGTVGIKVWVYKGEVFDK